MHVLAKGAVRASGIQLAKLREEIVLCPDKNHCKGPFYTGRVRFLRKLDRSCRWSSQCDAHHHGHECAELALRREAPPRPRLGPASFLEPPSSETVCLSYGGNEQIGSFKLDFYDSSENQFYTR